MRLNDHRILWARALYSCRVNLRLKAHFGPDSRRAKLLFSEAVLKFMVVLGRAKDKRKWLTQHHEKIFAFSAFLAVIRYHISIQLSLNTPTYLKLLRVALKSKVVNEATFAEWEHLLTNKAPEQGWELWCTGPFPDPEDAKMHVLTLEVEEVVLMCKSPAVRATDTGSTAPVVVLNVEEVRAGSLPTQSSEALVQIGPNPASWVSVDSLLSRGFQVSVSVPPDFRCRCKHKPSKRKQARKD